MLMPTAILTRQTSESAGQVLNYGFRIKCGMTIGVAVSATAKRVIEPAEQVGGLSEGTHSGPPNGWRASAVG